MGKDVKIVSVSWGRSKEYYLPTRILSEKHPGQEWNQGPSANYASTLTIDQKWRTLTNTINSKPVYSRLYQSGLSRIYKKLETGASSQRSHVWFLVIFKSGLAIFTQVGSKNLTDISSLLPYNLLMIKINNLSHACYSQRFLISLRGLIVIV